MENLSREAQVARVFVELTDSLVEEFDVIELLTTVTLRCVDVAGAHAAGLLLANADNALQLAAASSDEAQLVELIALQSQEGPCYETFETGEPVAASDLRQEVERWPEVASAAIAMRFNSAHAVPLRLRSSMVGVLGLFHGEIDGLSSDDVAIAQAFADVATICMLQHRTVEGHQTLATQLKNALDTRVVIEQAKGVIVGQTGWPMEEAFAALRRFARSSQRKLADVAADVIDGRVSADALM